MGKGLDALKRIGKQKYKTTIADITGFETVTVSVKQDNKKDYNTIEKELTDGEKYKQAVELLKLFDFKIENYTDDLRGAIIVNSKMIILDDEEIDLLKEVLL